MIRSLFISLLLLCGSLTAQQIYFSNNYAVYNTTNSLGSVVQKPDSGYVFVTNNSGAVYGYSIISTDKFGDTLFSKNYILNQTSVYVGFGTHSLIAVQDGNFVGCGSIMDTSNNRNGYVVKFSPTGDTLWTKIIGGAAFDAFNSLYEDSSGTIWMCGSTWSSGNGQGDVWLVRMNANGLVLSDSVYGTAQNETALCGELTTDGGFIMSGYSTSCPYVIKLDSNRQVEWQYTYCNYDGYSFVSQLNDSEYVVACCKVLSAAETQACLLKLDSQGGEVWNRTFGFVLNEEILWGKPVVLSDGIVVTGSSQPPSDYSGGYLAKTDLDGYMTWQRRYMINPNSYQEMYNVIHTSDDGFLVSGYCYITNQDAWLLKVDRLGCDSIGCDGVGFSEPPTGSRLAIFPNPGSTVVTISTLDANSSDSYIEIVNTAGQLIDRLYFGNQTSISINLDSYPEGLFFVRMISQGECLAFEKLMISK